MCAKQCVLSPMRYSIILLATLFWQVSCGPLGEPGDPYAFPTFSPIDDPYALLYTKDGVDSRVHGIKKVHFTSSELIYQSETTTEVSVGEASFYPRGGGFTSAVGKKVVIGTFHRRGETSNYSVWPYYVCPNYVLYDLVLRYPEDATSETFLGETAGCA